MAQPLLADTFGKFTYTDEGTSITITGYTSTAMGAVAIPKTIIGKPVTAIKRYAFSSCASLTSISIPNSVTHIRDSAFEFCTGLTSVTIPNSVTYIDESVFAYCTGLTSVTIPNSVTSIWTGAFDHCTSLTSLTIPNSVIGIGDYAFEFCTGLTSVTIPNSVTSIGSFAFYFCTGLTRVTLGTGVTYLGEGAFSYCTGLTSVSIPNSVTDIGGTYDAEYRYFGVFEGCTGLTSVSIGSGVKTIGYFAFKGCTGLTSALFLGSAPAMGLDVFGNTASSFNVYYLEGSTGFTSPTWMGYPSVAVNSMSFPEIELECPAGSGIADGSASVDFGSVALGSNASKTFTIKNTGTSDLTGLTIIKDGASAADFTVTNNPVSPVPGPTGNTSFTVRFTPGGAGTRSASIHIASNDGDENPFDIDLTGTGTGTGSPEISVHQPAETELKDGVSSISFGAMAVKSSASKTFTIKNTGTANLTGLAITKDGANAVDYTVTANPVSPVTGPTGSTTFTLRFTPGGTGARRAAIHIASNDANESPFDIVLTGTGIASPEITVQQPAGTDLKDGVSSKSFGSVALKSTASKTFTIRNSGTANLTGLVISKSGTNAKDFTVTPPLKSSLAPGASTTFKVIFKPSVKGTRKAAIHIKSNDNNENPFDIALTGKGVAKKAAPSALASAARLPSWSASGDSAWLAHDIRQTVGTVQWLDGRRYLTLTVIKPSEDFLLKPTVEVSPNLIDWYSGRKHATVITDDASRLKVRDNTPLTPGTKRYIRLNQIRQ